VLVDVMGYVIGASSTRGTRLGGVSGRGDRVHRLPGEDHRIGGESAHREPAQAQQRRRTRRRARRQA
jgi:hypothetical protein